jgi:tRNA(Ile)-lysidine synthase TilS/MesJ
MRCNRCRDDPVIFQPSAGRPLCRDHFIADFEVRAKRAIRQYRWLLPGDRIAVSESGDPASRALLGFLQRLTAGRRDVSVVALTGDVGPAAPGEAAEMCGATKIALPASVDDMAVSVLSNFLRGCNDHRPLYADLHRHNGEPPFRIYPFSHIPENEILLYASLQGYGSTTSPPSARETFDDEVRALLDRYTGDHPGTRYAVANLGRELASCSPQGEVQP